MAARPAAAKPGTCTFDVSMIESLAEQVREDAERSGMTVSAWMAQAARRHLADARERAILRAHRDQSAQEALRRFEEERGAITDEEMYERTREWPG